MEYVKLPGSGLEVSKICLGTMTFGQQVDEATGVKAIAYALDMGVNFVDTANIYTGGKSETITGKALVSCRDRVILASKVGLKVRDGINGIGLSRHAIITELEHSLKRLNTDYLDIYYMHAPDYATPMDESLRAMDDMVASGKVRYIGTSNFAAWQLCRLHHTAKELLLRRPVITQTVYNLITRGIEQELLPFLDAYDIALTVYNPLAGGLLTDKYAEKQKLAAARLSTNAIYAERYWTEENLRAWDDAHAIAKECGLPMAQLAMRWLISSKRVSSIITGFSSLEQLQENLSMDWQPLDPATLQACDALWNKLAGARFQYNR